MAYIPEQQNQKTAFDELSTSEPSPAIQIIFPYNINTDLVATSSNGTAFVTASQSKAQVNTGASANQSASLQSKDALRYQTGQGGLVRFTSIFTAGAAGSMQLAGYGDDLSGYFFGYSGSQFGLMRRNNGTESWTFQSNWSEQKFNGSDTSRMTLDPTKGNVYQIRFQWLGFGPIRWFIEDSGSGKFELAHIEKYTNSNTVPSIPNPSLPIYFEAKNWTNATNIKVETSSISGLVEGRLQNRAPIRNVWSWATNATALTNMLTIHNMPTFHNVRNRVRVVPDSLHFTCGGANNDGYIVVVKNTTNITSSLFEIRDGYSVVHACTQSVTPLGGQNLGIFPIAGNSNLQINLDTWDMKLHPGESFTVSAKCGAAGSPISCSLGWHELH